VLGQDRVPKRFDYGSNPRVPQLLCLANVGWRITTTDYIAKHKGNISIGEHGYDNADPLMQALFVAHGPAFRVDPQSGFPECGRLSADGAPARRSAGLRTTERTAEAAEDVQG
jgi:predicted AlkP superfamily pyrophosphatase or phosphodiesterase